MQDFPLSGQNYDQQVIAIALPRVTEEEPQGHYEALLALTALLRPLHHWEGRQILRFVEIPVYVEKGGK